MVKTAATSGVSTLNDRILSEVVLQPIRKTRLLLREILFEASLAQKKETEAILKVDQRGVASAYRAPSPVLQDVRERAGCSLGGTRRGEIQAQSGAPA